MRSQVERAGVLPRISSYLPGQKLLSALDNANVGVVICDQRLRYKALNQTAAKIHNMPIKAHLGHSFHQVLGNLAERVAPIWETVLVTGRPLTNLEVTGNLPKRSGVGRWVVNLFPVMEGNKRVTHVGCFVIEINPTPASSFLPSGPTGMVSSVTGDQPASPNLRQRTLLSHREQEVLALLAEGKSSKEISSVLGISYRTVGTYRARLMLKLDSNSIVDLVHYAIRNHIVTV